MILAFGARPRRTASVPSAPAVTGKAPDPRVFGAWQPSPWGSHGPWAACARCQVTWVLAGGFACWSCGWFFTGSHLGAR